MLTCIVPVVAGCGASLTLNGAKQSAGTTGSPTPAAPGTPPGGSGTTGNGPNQGNGSSPSSPTTVPANALSIAGIQRLPGWQASTDTAGGGGSASGATAIVATPSLSGDSRAFTTSYANYGDERYAVAFGVDTAATNFFYDGWVYLAGPSSDIANLEMDLNQVLANGQTVLFGFQCDGYSGTWDYTENAGTVEAPVDQWEHTTAACDPRNWQTDTWHHVQISFSRDDAGNVTYNAVWLDGNESALNVTAPSAFALGWSPMLVTNFQVDGLGSGGSSTAYLDNLIVYRW